MSKCIQKNCQNEGIYRFTWPGKDEAVICESCLPRLKNAANALDFYVQIRLVEPAVLTNCDRCDGCGLIADSENGEPWTVWKALPPGADIAVRMGMVKPIPCPKCSKPAAVAP